MNEQDYMKIDTLSAIILQHSNIPYYLKAKVIRKCHLN